jgi:hypothetical protein
VALSHCPAFLGAYAAHRNITLGHSPAGRLMQPAKAVSLLPRKLSRRSNWQSLWKFPIEGVDFGAREIARSQRGTVW